MKKRKSTFLIFLSILFVSGIIYIGSFNKIFQKNFPKEINKKTLAFMINDGDGEYKKVLDMNFLEDAYVFNNEKSTCLDNLGNTLTGVDISYNQSTNKFKIVTDKTVNCYLYFDKKNASDDVVFYIGGVDNPLATNTLNSSIYIKWQNQEITHYCVSENNDTNFCEWHEVLEKNEITQSYKLSDGEGIKTLYVFLKDSKNNISQAFTDTIIYKNSIKGNINFYIGGETNPDTINDLNTILYLNWEDEDVTHYCITTTNSSDLCEWETLVGNSLSTTYSLDSFTGNIVLYAHLKDKYGNIKSVSDSINYEEN